MCVGDQKEHTNTDAVGHLRYDRAVNRERARILLTAVCLAKCYIVTSGGACQAGLLILILVITSTICPFCYLRNVTVLYQQLPSRLIVSLFPLSDDGCFCYEYGWTIYIR